MLPACCGIREAGRVATLTYKGVPQGGKHKSREELEVKIDNAAAMTAIVERLGYRPCSATKSTAPSSTSHGAPAWPCWTKLRSASTWSWKALPHWIDRTARRLGFQESDYITASYGRIYLDWCAAKGLAPGDMTFE